MILFVSLPCFFDARRLSPTRGRPVHSGPPSPNRSLRLWCARALAALGHSFTLRATPLFCSLLNLPIHQKRVTSSRTVRPSPAGACLSGACTGLADKPVIGGRTSQQGCCHGRPAELVGLEQAQCCVLRQPSAPVDPPACSGP